MEYCISGFLFNRSYSFSPDFILQKEDTQWDEKMWKVEQSAIIILYRKEVESSTDST